MFRPYASIGSNLLFLEKGEPTRETWFWEHRVPPDQKAYSMTKPIRQDHLADCARLVGRDGPCGSDRGGPGLARPDRGRESPRLHPGHQEPDTVADDHGDPEVWLAKLLEAERETTALRDELRSILAEALTR